MPWRKWVWVGSAKNKNKMHSIKSEFWPPSGTLTWSGTDKHFLMRVRIVYGTDFLRKHNHVVRRQRGSFPENYGKNRQKVVFHRARSVECADSGCERTESPSWKKYITSWPQSTCLLIKSANVFLSLDNQAKLGDMNVSKISEKGLCRTQTGTPYYASPEVWKDQPYGPKSDIWSLGCVIYEMITLHPPFQAEDMEGLYKKVTRCDYPKIPLRYSSDLNDMIRVLLQVDPLKRPSCCTNVLIKRKF